MKLKLNSGAPTNTSQYYLNGLHSHSSATICSRFISETKLPEPETEGRCVSFDLHLVTGPAASPLRLLKRRFTLTLDSHYQPTSDEQAYFSRAYGVGISDCEENALADLNTFMQRTGLKAEQVEMLLARRSYAVRLSPNCPSKNLQSAGVGNAVPFPHANHYGACYVNGTGSGLYDSVSPPTSTSILHDKFDNAMDLAQVETGDSKALRLTKTSLNRFDRLQRMIRLQRWTGIPFAKLDTLICSAIRAEGEANLGMELNENTLRVLGVYRHLNQRHGIDPQEFAALLHDLTPYASGKDEVPLFDQVFNRVQLFDTPLILDQTELKLSSPTPADQKTLLQLCAGLGLQPTEDSLLLIGAETQKVVPVLKRDLATVSSLYRQARIARLLGLPVADLLTLARLLGGNRFKTALASGHLKAVTTPESPDTPDILDVLMQLDWAVDWLKDSQQTVALLQQRLGPDVPLGFAKAGLPRLPLRAAPAALSDEHFKRLGQLREDALRSVVTEQEVLGLGLPAQTDATKPVKIDWFERLGNYSLLDEDGLLPVLDRPLTLIDAPQTWLRAELELMIKPLVLAPEVKEACAHKLLDLLLNACDRQRQLLEALFQETGRLPAERTLAVIHWAHSSVYSLLVDACLPPDESGLVEQFERVSRHAEIALQLRLSDSALRLFGINPGWLGGNEYPGSSSEPALCDLYLFERYSHWLHGQRHAEDALLSYFTLANPGSVNLKNKSQRLAVANSANRALAQLLDWSEKQVAALTDLLPRKCASSMAQVDWLRRCQQACRASGLDARTLLQASDLHAKSNLDAWQAVGDAVMATHNTAAHPSLAND